MRLQFNTVTVDTGVSEGTQETEFMNATLQGVGNYPYAMSIATHLDLPTDFDVAGQVAVAQMVLVILAHAAEAAMRMYPGTVLGFEVQMGSKDDDA